MALLVQPQTYATPRRLKSAFTAGSSAQVIHDRPLANWLDLKHSDLRKFPLIMHKQNHDRYSPERQPGQTPKAEVVTERSFKGKQIIRFGLLSSGTCPNREIPVAKNAEMGGFKLNLASPRK